MKTLKIVAPAMVLVAGLIMSSTTTQATPAYQKKEKGSTCVTCHVKAGTKDLNDAGKFYKEKKTLEGAPKAAPKA